MGKGFQFRHNLALALVASTFLFLPVRAQDVTRAIASLQSVDGHVMVSNDFGLASARKAIRVEQGARVITTIGSKVEVRYDNGCTVPLRENEGFTVQTGKSCEALRAQVRPMFQTPAVAALSPAASVAGAPLVGGAGLASALTPTAGALAAAGSASAGGALSLAGATATGSVSAAAAASAAGSLGSLGAAGVAGAAGSVSSMAGLAAAAIAAPTAGLGAAVAAAGYAGYKATQQNTAVSGS